MSKTSGARPPGRRNVQGDQERTSTNWADIGAKTLTGGVRMAELLRIMPLRRGGVFGQLRSRDIRAAE